MFHPQAFKNEQETKSESVPLDLEMKRRSKIAPVRWIVKGIESFSRLMFISS